mmetsp:Transcript_40352/g.48913  ORF Transcript_40352/g.48913 Transcript_40352/m.48913 type:complete len:117 (+) Transcript_40352:1352-1702(+)
MMRTTPGCRLEGHSTRGGSSSSSGQGMDVVSMVGVRALKGTVVRRGVREMPLVRAIVAEVHAGIEAIGMGNEHEGSIGVANEQGARVSLYRLKPADVEKNSLGHRRLNSWFSWEAT